MNKSFSWCVDPSHSTPCKLESPHASHEDAEQCAACIEECNSNCRYYGSIEDAQKQLTQNQTDLLLSGD